MALGFVEAERDTVLPSPRPEDRTPARARRHSAHWRNLNIGKAAMRERRGDKIAFPCAIATRRDMLQRATATDAEMRAGRGCAPGPGLENFFDPSARAVLRDPQDVARKSVGHEHTVSRDTMARMAEADDLN